MITFIGLVSLVWAFLFEGYMKSIGQYDLHTNRWTDWFVVVPAFGGFGCLLYSLAVVMSRFLQ